MREDVGMITITTGRVSGSAERPDEAVIRVTDTGCGIPVDVLPRIFDPLFTTHPEDEAMGMGLAMVQKAIDIHGGRIDVKSEVGRGSTFIVSLPELAESMRGEAVSSARQNARVSKRWRVMLVDDEPLITEAAGEFLRLAGLEVRVFTASLDALDVLLGEPDAFDIAIVDQTMPHLTGLQFVERIRKFGVMLPVLLCTGRTSEATCEALDRGLVNGVLEKPYAPWEAIEAIEELCGP
jgi:CheY-like chemotaxis protein